MNVQNVLSYGGKIWIYRKYPKHWNLNNYIIESLVGLNHSIIECSNSPNDSIIESSLGPNHLIIDFSNSPNHCSIESSLGLNHIFIESSPNGVSLTAPWFTIAPSLNPHWVGIDVALRVGPHWAPITISLSPHWTLNTSSCKEPHVTQDIPEWMWNECMIWMF